MVFNPVEFYRLAGEIYSTHKNQAGYRATVGRAYYAAFLSARDKACIASDVQDGHKKVVMYYQNLMSNPKLAAVGNRLDALRAKRKTADYSCSKEVVARDAGAALQLSKTILTDLGHSV